MYATESYVERKVQTIAEIKSFAEDIKRGNWNLTNDYIAEEILRIIEKHL